MMDGSRVVELSFANGKIYKKTKRFNNESIQSYEQSEDCVSFYEQNTSSFTDPIFSLFAIKKYKNNETKIKYIYAQMYRYGLGLRHIMMMMIILK